MADSIIGALRVVLGLDTAAFSSGAKEAQSALDILASSFKKAIAGLGLGTLAYDFTKSVKGAIDAADELNKASQKFGVPIEQLSALKYAADLSNVSFESLGKGLGRLAKDIVDGATNPASDAAKSFKALGISATDSSGNIKDTGTVFNDIAAKFATMENGAAKTALAIKLFGRSGADLIPLLNQGAKGIQALTDEAARLGIVISAETGLKAEQFNDTLKKIEATSRAAYLQIAAGLLDGLQKLADQFVNAQQKGGLLEVVIKELAQFLEDINNGINDTIAQFNTFKAVTKDTGTAVTNTSNEFGNLYLNLDNLNAPTKSLTASTQTLSETYRQQVEILNANKAAHMTFETGLKSAAKTTSDFNLSALNAKDAIDKFIESQTKAIAGVNAQAASVGAAIGVHEQLRVTMEGAAIAAANHTTMTTAQSAAIQDLGNKAAAAAVNVAATLAAQDLLTPWEKYEKKLRDIVQFQNSDYPLSLQKMQQAQAVATAAMIESYGKFAADAAGNFAMFFNQFAQGNKDMFIIAKAFSISQALINSYVAFTKALASLPPPFNYVAAAAVLAAGIAMVAKIIAEKPPAAARGGSFMVPGGSMSVDTKLVPMALAPGERVDVTPAGQAGRTASGVLQISPIRPKDFFTGDTVREMVLSIDQWMRDGGSGVRFARG